MDERRRQQRVNLEQLIEISYDREEFLKASSLDLSIGGMKVLSPRAIYVGTRVFVMFTLSCNDEEPAKEITGEAIAVHCEKSGEEYMVGFRFDDMSDDSMNALNSCVGL